MESISNITGGIIAQVDSRLPVIGIGPHGRKVSGRGLTETNRLDHHRQTIDRSSTGAGSLAEGHIEKPTSGTHFALHWLGEKPEPGMMCKCPARGQHTAICTSPNSWNPTIMSPLLAPRIL